MPLQKQNLNINFAQGLDTKTDSKQVEPGKFLQLENMVFQRGGLLQKRNGYAVIPPVSADASGLTTYDGGLIATGKQLQVYSDNTKVWTDVARTQNIDLSVVPAVMTNVSKVTCDSTTAQNLLSCVVWTDADGDTGYQIIDSETGQIILPAVALPSGAANPKAFSIGKFFVITYILVSGSTNLYRIAIPINEISNPSLPVAISSVVNGINAPYDGYVFKETLYITWVASPTQIRFLYISQYLIVYTPISPIIVAETMQLIAITADDSSHVWITYMGAQTVANTTILNTVGGYLVVGVTSTIVIEPVQAKGLTIAANDGICTIIVSNNNPIIGTIPRRDKIVSLTIDSVGVYTKPTQVANNLGLASKAFFHPSNERIYFLGIFNSSYQPTYFLVDVNYYPVTDIDSVFANKTGYPVGKLAPGNAGDYILRNLLPSVTIINGKAEISYLIANLLVSSTTGATNQTPPVLQASTNTYTQKAINIAYFSFNDNPPITVETAGSLYFTGAVAQQYDGADLLELGFHLYPEIDSLNFILSGSFPVGAYTYAVTYEWTDAQGNIHRSAPSIPMTIVQPSGKLGIELTIPRLYMTGKWDPNAVRIVIYRASTVNTTFHQVTSIQNPLSNSIIPGNFWVATVKYTDTLPDDQIQGNPILYTTGGVIENIGPPASAAFCLFDNRLWLLSSEDRNLLWFSKEVLQATPVEMSDLLTKYVAPNIGVQGSTGPMTALSTMDEKLIIFKNSAINYIAGTGPDNTGSNSQYSEPTFVTSTVGCDNQRSIVFIPQGLMFQSDKGIWLLSRDLSTSYIGAPVEEFNSSKVLSAISIPGTNQVRFTLDSGDTLMYDYYFNQWATFTNIPSISSTLYQGLHAYVTESGGVFHETPGKYMDSTNPVEMSFTTSWLNLAGLQGYERAYYFFFLGNFITPHRLSVNVAYDYELGYSQSLIVQPDNYSTPWGGDPVYGSTPGWGGVSNLEQWRIFFLKQKVQAFKVKIKEIYDPSFGVVSGAGLTMSGLNFVFGLKKGYPRLSTKRSTG